mgnify:CR=1 FL=1
MTFTLLDRTTGLPSGFPRIVKTGPPATAFNGCYAVDTPLPHLDLGASFLADGTELGMLPRLADLERAYRDLWKLYVLAGSDDPAVLATIGEVVAELLPEATNVYRPRD